MDQVTVTDTHITISRPALRTIIIGFFVGYTLGIAIIFLGTLYLVQNGYIQVGAAAPHERGIGHD